MPSSTSPGSASDVNNWNSFKTDEGFIWSSHIPRVTAGERVTAWQDTVLRAGERHGILRVVEALDGAFRWDRDGSIADWLVAHGDRVEPFGTFPAGFLLGRPDLYLPAARLAYATGDGMTETWFTNVADLAGAAGLPPHGRVYPPLSIDPSYWDEDDSFTVSLATATDIWFPHNHPAHRVHDGPIDNRVVSARNAPRLNAFLTEVRTACQALGGDWRWTSTPAGVWEVDDEGLIRG
ncbi:hypothetical protein [Actinoplanes regularis]|uniref:hypothetical protein n=1 Tax=Actinoplanes regularis TaxID=52697 RepID=UPI002555BF26|nr:hypothetical protein [Actinoplanes regularis]GLW27973.1 hypothetical protein Areg01_09130 [Actinoplanes regularis]